MKPVSQNLAGKICVTFLFIIIFSACGGGSAPSDDVLPSIPVLQINNTQVVEGNSGLATAEVNITLSAASNEIVKVDYATENDSATAPDDYQSSSGMVTFAAGETAQSFTINVVSDTQPEADESFNINFSNPQNVTLGATTVTVVIEDDDSGTTFPALQVGDVNITEGNTGTTTAEFNVTLSASSTNTVTVDYVTSDLTATAAADYQSKNGSLSFAPGEISKTVTVNVVTDDIPEPDETFRLTLSNPGNASLSKAVGVATITNDDIDSTTLLSNPGSQFFDEEQEYTIDIIARTTARVFVSGMPPGMHWDEVNRRFDFRPDFIQGGKSWQITMDAVDGTETDTQKFTVTINNTIQPPWPTLVETADLYKVTKYSVTQVTDDFLDSPGHAGREFKANLAIPDAASAANLLPVRIGLHGFGGSPGTVGREGHFGIAPHDINNTWWTGYNDQLPLESGKTISTGTIPNYTQRRVMHLLSYLMNGCPGLETSQVNACPGANPERISVSGQSMGGTGSFFLAINYGYHFAAIGSRIGGTIPEFLSPGSQDGLIRFHWGKKDLGLPDHRGTNVWEQYDSSRAALNNKDFRNLHFSSINGKNDPVISFNAMVGISPVTGTSFFAALQDEGIGYFSVWDLRGHSGSERDFLASNPEYPGLGDSPLRANWWDTLDDTSFLSRNLAFPAFSNGSADDDAGEPDGMGGYTGTLRGAHNRYLRWDSANIIDTRDQLSMPIKADIDTTGTPPDAGYPAEGNGYFGQLPITADVTIRRIQQFQTLPGEAIHWNYDGQSGTVFANDDGSVTVLGLEMTTAGFTSLVLTRL